MKNLIFFRARILQQLFRDFLIFQRKNARQHFHDRHIRSESGEDGREFDSNGARPDHKKGVRNTVQIQDLLVSQNVLSVQLQTGKQPGFRPGGNEDILGLHFLSGFTFNLDRARGADRPLPAKSRDLVLLHQEVRSHRKLLDNLVLSGL